MEQALIEASKADRENGLEFNARSREDESIGVWKAAQLAEKKEYDFPRTHNKFILGDLVTKTKGSQWSGKVVGWYSTLLTPEGYAVESSTEVGSVQIYPAAALDLVHRNEVHPTQGT